MNAIAMQTSVAPQLPAATLLEATNRVVDAALRGAVQLSQLNAQALTRSVEEQTAVAREAQDAPMDEAASLQSRSTIAGGTKLVAYAAHVQEIWLSTLGEVSVEWEKLYLATARAASDSFGWFWSSGSNRIEEVAQEGRQLVETASSAVAETSEKTRRIVVAKS